MTVRLVPNDLVDEARQAHKQDFLERVAQQEAAAFMRVDTLEKTAHDIARRAEKVRELARHWW